MAYRARSRYVALVVLFVAALTPACQRSEPKPLAERLLEKAIQRCTAMVRKSVQPECEDVEGKTVREAINGLHRMMVDQATTVVPASAVCWRHSFYLVCDEETRKGPSRSVLYRVSSADDGSDSQVLSVWSEEW